MAALQMASTRLPHSDSSALAFRAYEAMAPLYDRFTADYEYEGWLEAIEVWAAASGLRGNRLLDVACGTGKSFLPMLARGYKVTACDLSPSMVAKARRKAPTVAAVVADMRELPWVDCFDLLTCLDDAINYLLSEDDLHRALRSFAAALAPGGIAVFDANSLATYRSTFSESFVVDSDGWTFEWRGENDTRFRPGEVAAATLTAVGSRFYPPIRHVQRHWPVEVLRSACEAAGFDRVAFRGQITGGRLVGDPDEAAHTKVVCLATRTPRRSRPTVRAA